MNRRTFTTALGSALIAVSAGCTETTPASAMSKLESVTELQNPDGDPHFSAIRAVDREAGIVIYYNSAGAGVGIDTVPIEQTNFSRDNATGTEN